MTVLFSFLFCSERQECDVSCTFDSNSKLTLMFRTVTGDTARQNFTTFRNVTAKFRYVFIIDCFYFINTEAANFFLRLSASFTSQ